MLAMPPTPCVTLPDDTRCIAIGPITIRVLFRGQDTGGSLESFEFHAPAGSRGPTMHTHAGAAESFYVLEGSLKLIVDGVTHLVPAGGVAHVPAHVPHRFEYPGPGPTRFLATLAPAIGLDGYFTELRTIFETSWPPTPEAMAALVARYDMKPA